MNKKMLLVNQSHYLQLMITVLLLISTNHILADSWDSLRSGGHFVLLRHAIAPGYGDPANFDVHDCAKQRNLSKAGIQQAKRIGQLFKKHAITTAQVYSSQWCRCLDTAHHLMLGEVIPLPILNSFFSTPDLAIQQTSQLKNWLNDQDFNQVIVLVTHQVNITALSGVFPSSGELVIMKRLGTDHFQVIDTIKTDN